MEFLRVRATTDADWAPPVQGDTQLLLLIEMRRAQTICHAPKLCSLTFADREFLRQRHVPVSTRILGKEYLRFAESKLDFISVAEFYCGDHREELVWSRLAIVAQFVTR